MLERRAKREGERATGQHKASAEAAAAAAALVSGSCRRRRLALLLSLPLVCPLRDTRQALDARSWRRTQVKRDSKERRQKTLTNKESVNSKKPLKLFKQRICLRQPHESGAGNSIRSTFATSSVEAIVAAASTASLCKHRKQERRQTLRSREHWPQMPR